MRPIARSDGLVVRRLTDEVVVYDTASHRAHCLNRTAAFVFAHADGRRTAAEIAELLGRGSDPLVGEALEQLAGAGLLAEGPEEPPVPSRREALRRVGLGAALLAPVVASLLVPTPAEAAATCVPVTACTEDNYGQPCYVSNPSTECTQRSCQGATSCLP